MTPQGLAARVSWFFPASTALQNKFTKRICSTVPHRVRSSRGDPTTIARLCAREIATFSRFGLKRNSIPRGDASPLLAHIDTITTAACCP